MVISYLCQEHIDLIVNYLPSDLKGLIGINNVPLLHGYCIQYYNSKHKETKPTGPIEDVSGME